MHGFQMPEACFFIGFDGDRVFWLWADDATDNGFITKDDLLQELSQDGAAQPMMQITLVTDEHIDPCGLFLHLNGGVIFAPTLDREALNVANGRLLIDDEKRERRFFAVQTGSELLDQRVIRGGRVPPLPNMGGDAPGIEQWQVGTLKWPKADLAGVEHAPFASLRLSPDLWRFGRAWKQV